MEQEFQKTLAVIGGGAAGFFCACNAARMNPALRVVIFEKSTKLLSKVKVSGGGRCNVTHAFTDIPAFLQNYPRGNNFLKKSFHAFSPLDTIEWFSQRGVELKKEKDGRIFPISNHSQTIIDCLINEAEKYGVEILFQEQVKKIFCNEDEKNSGNKVKKFTLEFEKDNYFQTDFLCVASGGFPKEDQFAWLKGTKHSIVAPVPSLFTFNIPGHPILKLMGISLENVQVKIPELKEKFTGPFLITHWGFSGPAVLKLSAFAARELAKLQYQFSIHINWLPEYNEPELRDAFPGIRLKNTRQNIAGRNPFNLPSRLWIFLLECSEIYQNIRWSELTSKQTNKLVQALTGSVFHVNGKTTFKEEFVTSGGISLQEINAQTMESKIIPGLYFSGEIIDVDGITGGFNFQHAWTSGWCAAQAIASIAAS